jgi:predicted acylesterase/phospholipase RssA
MKRRPQDGSKSSITRPVQQPLQSRTNTGLVLSGGGARAAYQVGALRALVPHLADPSVITTIIGSSIGAINGLILASALKHGFDRAIFQLEDMWRKREFKNTFSGTPSQAFFRAVKMAVLQYMAPGPNATSDAIFNPAPLMREVEDAIDSNGGLLPESRIQTLRSVAVMTTMEGSERKPLLFLNSSDPIHEENFIGASFQVAQIKEITAKHGFASAALPSVLPPVELDFEGGNVRLVDGGISQNVPVDPAVRLGANRVILIDISGRDWWLRKYNEALDTRPTWEVAAGLKTFCMRPPETLVLRCQTGLGRILKETVGSSRGKFMSALGPVWPVFQLLKAKLGEEVAYEAMTYVALDPDYLNALMEQGHSETLTQIKKQGAIFAQSGDSYEEWMNKIQGVKKE